MITQLNYITSIDNALCSVKNGCVAGERERAKKEKARNGPFRCSGDGEADREALVQQLLVGHRLEFVGRDARDDFGVVPCGR